MKQVAAEKARFAGACAAGWWGRRGHWQWCCSVTPGYFAAMGIPIQQGRAFTSRDTADQPSVVVINETLAKQFFGARDPVGHPLKVLVWCNSAGFTMVHLF